MLAGLCPGVSVQEGGPGRNGATPILVEPEVSESSFSTEFCTTFFSALDELLTLTEDVNFHTLS